MDSILSCENIIIRTAILFVLVLSIFYLMYLPFSKKDKQVQKES